ncbi:hypothetical protein BDA99DRAFT_89866 [Phascolomyces articulosus]|uniref:Fanconi anaemia group A protein helical domain-containing protein n=1 Tax=Phascolomyces articulosus TaxID=60185 RepID=A0AAD5K875_9FUNG|nr:hypothetical protein BDA99DRAFT_89866 [Phascolomyces articulosus]
MFGLHMMICQHLAETYDIANAATLLEELNDAAVDVITNGFRDKERLSIILTMVQLLLLHASEMLGLRYQKWFQQMFIDPNSTHISTTRMGQQFLAFLESLVTQEIPAVLQIHGKALQGNRHLPVQQFISSVKTRLMELGLDQSLRTHPTSLHHPVQTSSTTPQRYSISNSISKNTAVSAQTSNKNSCSIATQQENTVETILMSFKETGLIPKSLLEDSIFRPLWFKKTFLPSLMQWQSTYRNDLVLVRDQMMQALKDRKKISDRFYKDYLKMNK